MDGGLRSSLPWTGAPGATTTVQGLTLGQYPGTANPYFPGLLDEVRIYGRALSASEIATLAAAAPTLDTDADGFPDASDCAPANAAVWAVPGEARNLVFPSPSDTTLLSWAAPTGPWSGATSSWPRSPPRRRRRCDRSSGKEVRS